MDNCPARILVGSHCAGVWRGYAWMVAVSSYRITSIGTADLGVIMDITLLVVILLIVFLLGGGVYLGSMTFWIVILLLILFLGGGYGWYGGRRGP